MEPKKGDKLFVVQTRVFAKNAADALRKSKKLPPTEAFVDSKWLENNIEKEQGIGFK